MDRLNKELSKAIIDNKKYQADTVLYILLLFLVINSSCKKHNKIAVPQNNTAEPSIPSINTSKNNQLSTQDYTNPLLTLTDDTQLMQVLRRIFEDQEGNIWFVGDGVFYYNRESIINFSDNEVFSKTVVRQILEDPQGNIWFGTSEGIIKYNPTQASKNPAAAFTKFTEKDGLISNNVWSMAIDHNGIIWIGTIEGVNQFDGKQFTQFAIPESKLDNLRGVTSSKIVYSIIQDSKERMWFGTNGGAYIYDGISLSNISKKDGLCNNSINDILEDKSGTIWFATHHKGVCNWDGNSFTHITDRKEVKGTEAWSLYEDHSGNIWFPIEHDGVYRYDPKSKNVTNFHKKEGLSMGVVHSIIEDEKGIFWFGGFEGLYNYNGKSFTPITRYYPWIN